MASCYKKEEEFKWGQCFGQNLQRMLHKKQIDQGHLARQLGTTDTMISRYVHGVSIPSVYKVIRFADIIGCDVGELIKSVYDE